MTGKPPTFDELKAMVGQKLGASGWTVVDQSRIDQFADCTGDHQWLHTDPERARRESPLRVTIAHGYLTLSIVGALCQDMGVIPENTRAAFNYGLDKVRFLDPGQGWLAGAPACHAAIGGRQGAGPVSDEILQFDRDRRRRKASFDR